VRHTARLATSSIDVALALTGAELDAASRLVHRCYLSRGYAKPSLDGRHTSPYLAMPSTVVFVARADDDVVATVSLIADSPHRLPCDALWGAALGAMRAKGARLAEVSALAVSEACRGAGLSMLRALVRAVGVYARDIAKFDTLCVAVHPRHASFYEALLRFRRFGSLTPCGAVNDAPAVGLTLDLSQLDGRVDEPFAAGIFTTEERRDMRARLERDLGRRDRPGGLKFLHSTALAAGRGNAKMC